MSKKIKAKITKASNNLPDKQSLCHFCDNKNFAFDVSKHDYQQCPIIDLIINTPSATVWRSVAVGAVAACHQVR